jgi:hypothetical protein
MGYRTEAIYVIGEQTETRTQFVEDIAAKLLPRIDALRDTLPLAEYLAIVDLVDHLIDEGRSLAEPPMHTACPYCCPDCLTYNKALEQHRQQMPYREPLPHHHPCTCP